MDRSDELRARGCPDHCIAAAHRAMKRGIGWEQIIAALMKFGQVLWQILNELFPPGPSPEPEPDNEGDIAKAAG